MGAITVEDLLTHMDQLPHKEQYVADFPQEILEQSLPARFELQVARYPERLAVQTPSSTFTYAMLNQMANRIAWAILSQRGKGAEPVALLLDSDAPMIAAMLGVLKAGKIYVPLDPSYPRVRIAQMWQDSQATLVVTETRHLALAQELARTHGQCLNIDALDAHLALTNPGLTLSPTTLAWILYTSGSTGRPKGVVQTHRNVLHFIRNYTQGFHICATDRLTLLFSCSVNGGAHEIFSALLNGASLHQWNVKEAGVAGLGAWLAQHAITIYSSVPTVWRSWLSTLTGHEQFPHLRMIKLIGEPVYRHDVEQYQKRFAPPCILVNRLGSTETGSIRWYCINKTTELNGPLVPVGYPVADNTIVLLDATGQVVAGDAIGEIAVRSRYLSPGYWQRLDLTQAVFLPDPDDSEARLYRTGDLGRMLPDGCLVHLGRKDFQVKIRGHRIEVSEIEATLLDLPTVREVAVIARPDHTGEQRLIAYLVPHAYPAPTVTVLRHTLAETLPDYMIPSAFVVLDSFPQAPNGKIDYRALPAPKRLRPDLPHPCVAPRTLIEAQLSRLWSEVLDLESIGVHDHFLDLGGHPLMATQIMARVHDVWHVAIPPRALLEASTVADMALVIIQHLGQTMEGIPLSSLLAEVEALSDDTVQDGL